MNAEYEVTACSGKSIYVYAGQTITVIDVHGKQVVDFFAENIANPYEFISPGVTIDCNESLKVKTGDLIYSNLYRPMLEILADDVGEHDLLHPCCRPEMYDFFYHNGEGHPNCLDNINRVMEASRPIIQPLNLFMYTEIDSNGNLTVKEPLSKPGDKIILMAKTDMRIGVAACSVSESGCNGGKCTSVKIIVEN